MENVLHVGFNTYVLISRIVCILPPTSSPTRRIKEEAKGRSSLIDATQGRKTRSLIITDSNHVILSPIQAETMQQRLQQKGGGCDKT
ncbi:MAG: DUF370 domain-containing protein [Desulfovibrionaceae bacterium]